MPWEITFQRADLESMDDVETIQSGIEAALPEIQYITEPSGLEKLEAAAKMGVEFPDVLKKHFELLPAKLYAVYNTDDFAITIYGFEAQPLARLHAEIRGNQNPGPILRSLCSRNAWITIDDQTGATIDLSETTPKQWLDFCGYQDSVRRENDEQPSSDI